MYAAASAFFGLLSMSTSAAIAFDRYQVIASPHGPLNHTSRKQAAALILFVWAYALSWAVSPLLGWNQYILDGSDTSCTFDYLTRSHRYTSLIVCMCIGGFLLPLIVIITYYYKLYVRVREHKRQFISLCNQMRAKISQGRRKYKRRKVEYDIAKTMMISVVLYCISWTPYAVIALIGQLGDQSILTPMATVLPAILAKASTIYNPFIYTLSHPRFRRRVPCSRLRMTIACYVKENDGEVGSTSHSRTSNSGTPFNRHVPEYRVPIKPKRLSVSYQPQSDTVKIKAIENTSDVPNTTYECDQIIKSILATRQKHGGGNIVSHFVKFVKGQDAENEPALQVAEDINIDDLKSVISSNLSEEDGTKTTTSNLKLLLTIEKVTDVRRDALIN